MFAFGKPQGPIDFENFKKDVSDLYEDELHGKAIKDVSLGNIISGLFKIAAAHRISIATDLTLLFKALVTIEGVAKEVYPELDILEEAKPYVTRLMTERYNPDRLAADMAELLQSSHGLIQALPRRIDRLLGELEQGRLIIRVEESDPRRSALQRERVAARAAVGISAAGFILASAILLTSGWYVFGFLSFLMSLPFALWTLFSAFSRRMSGSGV